MFNNDYSTEVGVHVFTSTTPPSRTKYYDFEKKTFSVNSNELQYGAVYYDVLTKTYFFGFYSQNLAKNALLLINGYVHSLFDKKYFREINFIEVDPDIYSNCRTLVYKKDGKWTMGNQYKLPMSKRKYSWTYNFPNNYGAKGLLNEFIIFHRENYVSNKQVAFNIPNISFGLEFETCSGQVPQTECVRLGLIPLKDGSISGNEYATVPLRNKEGIGCLSEVCDVLKEYTDIDHFCSLHVHVGVPSVSKELVVAAYNYFRALESSILAMFPSMITQSSSFKKGDKDYCKKLPATVNMNDEIEVQFNKLYAMYSESDENKFRSFTDTHPNDRDGNRKWDIHSRYKWINLINLLYGNAKTIEFRVHTPTLNKNKVLPWVYICVAIIDFLLKNTKEIAACKNSKQISEYANLKTILNTVYSEGVLADYLNSYIIQRINNVCHHEEMYGDRCGFIELLDDSLFSFTYKDVKLVE